MRSKLLAATLLALVASSYLAYVFRVIQPSFWTAGIGDWVDPYLINFILEHWYHSIVNGLNPASPPVFYPTEGALGFSHSLILYVPFYAALRPLLHPFIAHNMTLVIVMACGIVCLYLLLRRGARLNIAEALLLSAFFFTSPNVVDGGSVAWSQRLSVFLIPSILLPALESVRITERRARLSLAFGAGLLAFLLFSHDFPTAALALLLFGMTLAPLLVRRRSMIAARAVTWARERRRRIAVALLPLLVALIWSGSVVNNTTFRVWMFGTRTVSDGWLPPALVAIALIAFISVRTANDITWSTAFLAGCVLGILVFLWIYIPASYHYRSFPRGHIASSLREIPSYESWRPFIAIALAGVVAIAVRSTRRHGTWFLFVTAVVLLIPLRFGKWSIWLNFFISLPGFGAIREPYRIIYLYELAVVLAIGALMTQLSQRLRAGIVVMIVVLLATSWNRYRFSFNRPIDVYAAWVDAPIAVDPSCRSFFIAPASDVYLTRSPDRPALYGIDSMFIALKQDLPTLNGHTARGPRGWELYDPNERGYSRAVTQWTARHQLTGVCTLDIDNRVMRLSR